MPSKQLHLCLAGLLSLFPHLLTAHEFWLAPHQYQLDIGKPLISEIKVGNELKGESYAYFPHHFQQFDLTLAGQTTPINSRFAATPAVNQIVQQPGLAILSAITNAQILTYKKTDTFLHFLEYEGLDWVLAAHQQRELPEKGFDEAYRRYAKALFAIGSGQGNDVSLGLPLEWVLETNPYTSDSPTITARLTWQGNALPNIQGSVFKEINGEIKRELYRTDQFGKIYIPKEGSQRVLINAVYMTLPLDDTLANPKSQQAVWESHWASTTYGFDQAM